MKRIYDYIFYTFYRFWEKAPSKWWSEWKSILTISLLTVLILLSFYGFALYSFKIIEDPFSNSPVYPLLLGIVIYIYNHYYFLYNEKWKEKIDGFQTMNKTKDKIGISLIIVTSIVILISLIYSVYLVSTVDWQCLNNKQYFN